MKWSNLYNSLFAILRIDTKLIQNNAGIAGTGFVINTNPIYILTCNHVVGEGIQDNNGQIVYSITKRSDDDKEFDLRNIQISYMKVKKIFHKPELDLAILEIDPLINKDVAKKLKLDKIRALKLNFENKIRTIGSNVQWMSTGALGDLTLTPRFFKGNLITDYITDFNYKFKDSHGIEQVQAMKGTRLLEIDQLFIPGCSGSPLINSKCDCVIGYVHGFKSWPILTNSILDYDAEITENSITRKVKIKSQAPLVTSLSLAIDVRSVHEYLLEKGFLTKKKNFKWLTGQQKN